MQEIPEITKNFRIDLYMTKKDINYKEYDILILSNYKKNKKFIKIYFLFNNLSLKSVLKY